MAQVTFWFELASTYSYLSAMRVDKEAEAHGVEVVWQPFLLGPIFREQGWESSPFLAQPAKLQYMWRDIERRCTALGAPFTQPSKELLKIFPCHTVTATRVALVGLQEDWGKAFIQACYQAQYADHQDIGDEAVLATLIERAGIAPEDALEAAKSPKIKAELRANTEEAQACGLFGAPAFTIGDELFWGDDRLEDALDWGKAAS